MFRLLWGIDWIAAVHIPFGVSVIILAVGQGTVKKWSFRNSNFVKLFPYPGLTIDDTQSTSNNVPVAVVTLVFRKHEARKSRPP